MAIHKKKCQKIEGTEKIKKKDILSIGLIW